MLDLLPSNKRKPSCNQPCKMCSKTRLFEDWAYRNRHGLTLIDKNLLKLNSYDLKIVLRYILIMHFSQSKSFCYPLYSKNICYYLEVICIVVIYFHIFLFYVYIFYLVAFILWNLHSYLFHLKHQQLPQYCAHPYSSQSHSTLNVMNSHYLLNI
jgi:hypothetical protein